MKKILNLIVLATMTQSVWALSPRLNTTMELFQDCMDTVAVPLCDNHYDSIVEELENVNMDARGEFVYVLKDVLKKNNTEEVVLNLYAKLQTLVPFYTELDGTDTWSGRDMLGLFGEVSVEYVKYAQVDQDLLKDLLVEQKTPAARYKFLGALHTKADEVTKEEEIEALIAFSIFAKDYIKGLNDEYYIYQTAVGLIKKLTIKNISFKRGFEGLYEIKLLDPAASKTLKVDNLVVSSSDVNNGLIVNFVSSQLRATKFSFKGAGLLGNTAFSNEKVYIDNNELSSPGFQFSFDFDSKEIRGSFYSKRFGSVDFMGTQKVSNAFLYEVENDSDENRIASVSELEGIHKVSLGAYQMNLRIEQTDDAAEVTLINNNALIVFSNVTFSKENGVLKAIDWKMEKVLELKVTKFGDEIILKGQFTNSPLAKVLSVNSL